MSQFLQPDAAAELFAGYVVRMRDLKVISPDGSVLGKMAFAAKFEGYTFALDWYGDRTTTNAWKAFTQNSGFRPPIIWG